MDEYLTFQQCFHALKITSTVVYRIRAIRLVGKEKIKVSTCEDGCWKRTLRFIKNLSTTFHALSTIGKDSAIYRWLMLPDNIGRECELSKQG